jgi:hypothetical protein
MVSVNTAYLLRHRSAQSFASFPEWLGTIASQRRRDFASQLRGCLGQFGMIEAE